jgi:hypothetical protein
VTKEQLQHLKDLCAAATPGPSQVKSTLIGCAPARIHQPAKEVLTASVETRLKDEEGTEQ